MLTELPIALTAEWRSKTVTTDPPRFTPHEEWRLNVHLVADAPFRQAALMYRDKKLEWGLSQGPTSAQADVSLHFFPYDWSGSDDVQVSFGFRRIRVTDAPLKEDPRPHVALLSPETASTGQIVPIGEIASHKIQVALLAIAEQDIEQRRHARWRVKPKLVDSLPSELRQLVEGYQTGVSEA